MNSEIDAGRAESRDIAVTSVWWIANFSLLVFLSLFLAENRDAQSATLAADGALVTLLVVAGLAVANGVLLCLPRRTRWLGLGVLLGAAVTIPVGIGISAGFLGAHLS